MAGHMQGEMIGELPPRELRQGSTSTATARSTYVMFKGQEGNLEAIARTQYGGRGLPTRFSPRPASRRSSSTTPPTPASTSSTRTVSWASAGCYQLHEHHPRPVQREPARTWSSLSSRTTTRWRSARSPVSRAAGYNNGTAQTIPVFGVDATAAAQGLP